MNKQIKKSLNSVAHIMRSGEVTACKRSIQVKDCRKIWVLELRIISVQKQTQDKKEEGIIQCYGHLWKSLCQQLRWNNTLQAATCSSGWLG